MELAYERPVAAAVALVLEDIGDVIIRRSGYRPRPRLMWRVGWAIFRLGDRYLTRSGQLVIIDGHLLTPAELAKFDRGEAWMTEPVCESAWRRFWRRLRRSNLAWKRRGYGR